MALVIPRLSIFFVIIKSRFQAEKCIYIPVLASNFCSGLDASRNIYLMAFLVVITQKEYNFKAAFTHFTACFPVSRSMFTYYHSTT